MYNEEAVISENLCTLMHVLDKALPSEYEVIAVNDGSTDRTLETVSALCAHYPALRILSHTPNRGKGGALKEGMTAAMGRFVLFTDSDLAYGTAPILAFLERFEQGDIGMLLGSRALCDDGYAGYSRLRRLMSRVYLAFVKTAAGFRYSDSQCGIKGFENGAAKRLFGDLETSGFAFDLEILLAANAEKLPFCEMPVKVIRHGNSTVHPARDALRMLRDLRKIKKRQKEKEKQK